MNIKNEDKENIKVGNGIDISGANRFKTLEEKLERQTALGGLKSRQLNLILYKS
jgi:hypothetical protein